MKKTLLTFIAFSVSSLLFAQEWPTVSNEARPGSRWWWLTTYGHWAPLPAGLNGTVRLIPLKKLVP